MQGNPKNQESGVVRVELKYCEHCGGLWVRECGAGVVYCPNCQPKIEDLPLPKRKPKRVILPVGPRTVVGDYPLSDEEVDFEAAGGAV